MEKIGMDGSSTNSRAGFGFMHDGRVDTLTKFLADGFPDNAGSDQAIADLIALLLCFTGSDLTDNPSTPSQDVPAATGKQVTFSSPTPPAMLNAMFDLAMRANSRVELVLRGRKNGQMRSWLLRRATQDFQSDRNGEVAPTLAQVIASAAAGNEFTGMLVPEGSGTRLALDRDGDGYFDASEAETGFSATDPGSHPGRIVSISKTGANVVLAWESAPGARYTIETAAALPSPSVDSVWTAVGTSLISTQSITSYTNAPPSNVAMRFYRVRLEP
jgi:hypothetical protein